MFQPGILVTPLDMKRIRGITGASKKWKISEFLLKIITQSELTAVASINVAIILIVIYGYFNLKYPVK